MSYRNRQIQTKCKVVKSKVSALNIGGQVPSGMTRYITFLYVDNSNAGATGSAGRLYFISAETAAPTMVSLIATASRKFILKIAASAPATNKKIRLMRDGGPPFMIPDQIDTDKPLFTIAGGKWLGVWCSKCSAMNVMAQWFDE